MDFAAGAFDASGVPAPESFGFGSCADVAQTIATASSKPSNARGVPKDRLMVGSPEKG
jgi:hypothetical protein